MNSDAVKAASAYALPVAVGMFSIGVSYGFMMVAEGFSFWYSLWLCLCRRRLLCKTELRARLSL